MMRERIVMGPRGAVTGSHSRITGASHILYTAQSNNPASMQSNQDLSKRDTGDHFFLVENSQKFLYPREFSSQTRTIRKYPPVQRLRYGSAEKRARKRRGQPRVFGISGRVLLRAMC